jgi:DNA adenine methylase
LWLVPWFRAYLGCWHKPRYFLEAFAGSAIVGLSMLAEDRIGHLLLVEKDPDYVAVWQTILGSEASWLLDQIQTPLPSREELDVMLAREPASRREQAFLTLVQSWCYHRARRTNGCGLLPQHPSRHGCASIATAWKPQALALRIRALHDQRQRITVVEGCGIDAIQTYGARRDTFIYADPPYPTAGQRLYRYGAVDIPRLLTCCTQARGPVVVSCEVHDEVCHVASTLGLEQIRIPMRSANNRQEEELLLSNRPLPREAA